MYDLFISFLNSLNQLLTAGIAITPFSLLLYALSFNLRDRVARSFATILAYVVIVFVGDAISSAAPIQETEIWLRMQWIGIDDLRFRQLVMRQQPATQAVVFFAMDVSSSMRDRDPQLAKTFFFWVVEGLRLEHVLGSPRLPCRDCRDRDCWLG